MSRSRRGQIEDLFEAALDRPTEGRDAWLESECGDDLELKAEVQALLAAHEMAEEAFEAAERSSTVGPYRLIREIGRGGMGVVHLAERADGQYQQRVAIKVLRHRSDGDPVHRRFLAERQILAGLRHPNIAAMLDGGVAEDGSPYFVMEYVDGLPITAYCDRRRCSVDERLRLFMDVCSAVQHAHQNLVIHRDLKPGNILVTETGEVKLLDFGIAKLLEPGAHPAQPPLTRVDARVMTPEYASPEQVRGDPINTASDVYSLGVLLYELLTGCAPYDLGSGALVDVICERQPDRPSSTALDDAETDGTDETEDGARRAPSAEERASRRGTSPERLARTLRGDLDSIVLMALRKEPQARYASADVLRQDIERHLGNLPVLAHRGSRRYRVGRFLRRYKLETAAAALVALSLVGGAAVAGREAAIAAREQARAEAERAKAEEVSRFLEGLFSSIDPYAPTPERLDTLPVHAILDRGTARVRSELASQPLVQADMLDVIGRVYRSLGLFGEAGELAELSLERRRMAGDTLSEAYATSLGELGALLVETGEYRSARTALEEALRVRRVVHGEEERPETAESLNVLGRVLRQLGEYEDAERLHLEAMEMLRRAGGEDSPRLATFATDMVKTLEWAGDREGEEQWARESVELHRRLYGERHPALAIALRDLGLLLQRNGDHASARELFEESYAIALAALGEHHPQIADLQNRIASNRWWLGELEEADSVHQVSIALKRELYGDVHLEVAYGLNNLASVRRDMGRFASADSLLAEALDVTRQLVGEEHAAYWIIFANRATTFTTSGDCERSMPMHRAAIEGLHRTIPADVERGALQRRQLGICLTRRGAYDEAERMLLEAYRTLLPRGEADEFVVRTEESLRELYDRWGVPEEERAARGP